MKSVVLYARSATSKLEVDRQFQMMQESLDPGADVVGRYYDVGSGMDPQRPEFQDALDLMQKEEAECLVVHSLDRLTRSVQELARLASMSEILPVENPRNLG